MVDDELDPVDDVFAEAMEVKSRRERGRVDAARRDGTPATVDVVARRRDVFRWGVTSSRNDADFCTV